MSGERWGWTPDNGKNDTLGRKTIPPMFHPHIVHIRGCGQVANITRRSSSEAQAGRDLPHKNSASMLNRSPQRASDDDDMYRVTAKILYMAPLSIIPSPAFLSHQSSEKDMNL